MGVPANKSCLLSQRLSEGLYVYIIIIIINYYYHYHHHYYYHYHYYYYYYIICVFIMIIIMIIMIIIIYIYHILSYYIYMVRVQEFRISTLFEKTIPSTKKNSIKCHPSSLPK